MSYTETVVLSLGGSLIVPKEGVDTDFLNQFEKFVRTQIAEKKRRFFIICGGGSTARLYIDAATDVLKKSIKDEDKDWLGIHSTRLNAHLIRTIFRDIAYPRIFKHYDRDYDIADEPVVVCSGWKPGWSTDFDAVLIAEKFGARTIINMSNIDKVYDKDPKKFPDAKAIDKMTWEHFEKLVGTKWVPGLNAPFDPIATQKAKKMGLSVIILNGKRLKNLEAAIEGHKFIGTVIAPFTLDASFYDRKYYLSGDKPHQTVPSQLYIWLRALYRAITTKIFINPKSVLDVGCGLGEVIYFLRLFGVDAWGVEISDYALNNATMSIRKYIKQGSVQNIPFKDKNFDLVTSYDVLEHIYAEEVEEAISECTRVSKNYQLHKIYTEENVWLTKFRGSDLSLVTVMDRGWWENLWRKHKLQESHRYLPKPPQYFYTAYLLEPTN